MGSVGDPVGRGDATLKTQLELIHMVHSFKKGKVRSNVN